MKNTKEDIKKQRAIELKALIAKYDFQYYEEGESDVSDAEYDRLYDEYQKLEEQYPDLFQLADSPTRSVGAGSKSGETTGLPKITHKSPLLSIDRKAKELSALKEFYDKCGGDGTKVIIQPKLDGITCNINYENGIFSDAATRGNGYIGECITKNFKETNTKYPKELGAKMNLEIRGEAIIPYNYFIVNLAKEYSNPRNAVAGIMRQLNSKAVKGKGIQIMFYDIGQTNLPSFDEDKLNLEIMVSMGFQSVPTLVATTWNELKSCVESSMNGYIQEINGFHVLMDKEEIYPQAICDGLVVKVNNLKTRTEIGSSEKGPKWAFAYKFKPLAATTRIDHVEWQIGKSGRLTPVAIFNEVSLGGTKITRATLNNYEYMEHLPVLTRDEIISNKKPKKFGLEMDDLIIIERSNDVIPRIIAIEKHQNCVYQQDMKTTERVSKRIQSFNPPILCPVCGSVLKDIPPLLFCLNPLCSAQIKGRIKHFASRDALNIAGLGEGIIDILYDKKYLLELTDIYTLKNYKNELEALERFGPKKVNNLLAAIEKSKTPELWQFLYGLSIDGVGIKASKDLAKRYHTLENFLEAKKEDLLTMEDMGEISAFAIISYIQNDKIKEMLNKLRMIGVEPKQVSLAGNKLKGKIFVLTGILENPRKFYSNLIEKNGGSVSNSVSKKTNVVLIGTEAGSKEIKARELVKNGEDILLLDTKEKIDKYFFNYN
ncbi:MAG: NAD-dependent DNA ligase LigA [Erysipelotrichaceae bacterium]